MRAFKSNTRGVLAAAAALAVCTPPLAAGAGLAQRDAGGDERAAVRAGVVDALRRASPPDRELEAALEALVALAPPPIPELFQLLWAPGVPDSWLSAGETPLALGPVEHALLVDAFRALPTEATVDWLRSLERDVPDHAPRLTALRLLGSVARPTELRLMTSFATRADGGADSSLVLMYGSALTALIERHPATLELLRSTFAELPEVLLGPTVAAIGAARVTGRVEAIARLLGRVPPADPMLLSALTRIARAERSLGSEEARASVRMLLGRSEPGTALLATRAAGALQDTTAVEALIALLPEHNENVRAAAHAALREIVGQDLGPEAERWDRWFQEERRWWKRDSQGCVDVLLGGSATEAVAAVRRLAPHRLYRRELAGRIVAGLERREPEVVALVAGLLGDLGSRDAVEPLRRALARCADSELAERALTRALSRLAPDVPTPRTP